MPPFAVTTLVAAALLLALIVLFVVSRALGRLKRLAEEALKALEREGGQIRDTERALSALVVARQESVREALAISLGDIRVALLQAQVERFEQLRRMMEEKLADLRLGNEAKLAEIQKTVNEDLQAAVRKRMDESFSRVLEQFTAVQKAIGEVQAVTAEIGDVKRIFANVKTRGGWGETQLRVMLDDLLPAGSYETNCKVREGSGEAVEFAVRMPARGSERPLLPVDAKFPLEDYERLIDAAEAGDAEAERAARHGLARRMREEAKKIADKYINPPRTVEFAVLYLATDGLYAEIARIPGLIDELGRTHKVLVLGPSLFPALLRTIQLGFVTLALEQKADEVRILLGATKIEMVKMDEVLERLAGQAGRMANTIDLARRRTRA
ncbi:MAG: DNA recombination protein RmuC, partial [Acetobacteraceae bacterium]